MIDVGVCLHNEALKDAWLFIYVKKKMLHRVWIWLRFTFWVLDINIGFMLSTHSKCYLVRQKVYFTLHFGLHFLGGFISGHCLVFSCYFATTCFHLFFFIYNTYDLFGPLMEHPWQKCIGWCFSCWLSIIQRHWVHMFCSKGCPGGWIWHSIGNLGAWWRTQNPTLKTASEASYRDSIENETMKLVPPAM